MAPSAGVGDRVRVALLECDHVPDALRPLGDDYATMFETRFRDHAPRVALDRFDVIGGAVLPPVGAHDGYLITGSRHSVTEDLPWLARLRRFAMEVVAADLPVAGICFGHQLLADVLGGRVERAGVGWGVGVHAAVVESPQPWMQPMRGDFRLIVSHQDQVVALPRDGVCIASSPHAPIAAFQVGSALGFQGHPEFDPGFAAGLMDMRRDRIPAAVIAAAEASLRQPPDHATVISWLGTFLAGDATPSAARRDPATQTTTRPQIGCSSSG